MTNQQLLRPDGTNHHMGVDDVPEWTLGDRLRRSLRHAGISVADMATDLDVSLATMGRWLNDRGPVKRSILRLWAMTTGVSLEWLETGRTSDGGTNQYHTEGAAILAFPRPALVRLGLTPDRRARVGRTRHLRSVS